MKKKDRERLNIILAAAASVRTHIELIKLKRPLFPSGGIVSEKGPEIINVMNKEKDPVNNPSHYTSGKIEVIDYIQDQLTPEEFAGFCKGNALKYVSRAGKKDPAKASEDLAKANWYLSRLKENPAK